MKRAANRLGRGRFDLLIIGGGIAGAWTAYEAALRGLQVALVEAGDWGIGASGSSSKLIHGGLRYLEHGHFGLVAKSLRERARLMRLAPHRISALRFLLPIFPDSRTDRLPLIAGLRLYDLLAGSSPGTMPHRYLHAEALATHVPFLAGNLRGGFAYSDAGSDDARFTLEIIAGALAHGAVAMNHVSVDHLLRDKHGVIAGALVVDGQCGKAFEVEARVTINAAGAWANSLVPPACAPRVRLSKGVHLVMPPLPLGEQTASTAFLLTAGKDRRVFFLIPWYGATLLGTTDDVFTGDPDHLHVEEHERAYLLGEVARRCPHLQWGPQHIRGEFAGLRVLQGATGGSLSAASREWRLAEPVPGLLMPVGGKFTSARVEAGRTVDRACVRLGRRPHENMTAHRPFPWCPPGAWPTFLHQQTAAGVALGLDAETASTLVHRHGNRVGEVHARLVTDRTLAGRISPDAPFCLAEVAHAVVGEMAVDTEDVLRRRIPLTILSTLDAECMARVDAVMAAARRELGETEY